MIPLIVGTVLALTALAVILHRWHRLGPTGAAEELLMGYQPSHVRVIDDKEEADQ